MKSILIVEDDQEFVKDLLAAWSPPGHVRCAGSGREAVQAILEQPPDLILLDLSLPHYLADVNEEEGLSLLCFIRENLRLEVPAIVITRDGSPEALARALALGASGLLRKPISVRELEGAIGNMLGKEADRPSDNGGPSTVNQDDEA